MLPQLELGKLVGAASAPVALIIAASICLGNLWNRYAMLANIFRDCTREYRGSEDHKNLRSRSLERQIHHYSGRLRMLMKGTLWLTLALHAFVLTVVCTSIGVIFPDDQIWAWITGGFSFVGLFLLGGFVVIAMLENHLAKEAMMLETAEFPNVLPSKGSEQRKARFVDEAQR